ncbi:MAG TPA: glycosyltransferase family 87 protein [Candidatus Omnitrophota bacterium]|nr:glycosyltransferase family 87 protein [Candidatus Omnitrophota bacterium]
MRRHPGIEAWTVALIGSALAAAVIVPIAARASAALAGAGLIACFAALPWAARRVPESLRGSLRRRPVVAVLWLLLALVAVAQMGRLSAFMADSSRLWGSTFPDPVVSGHQCMSAYVHAADLARRGEENIYDPRWYPAFTAPVNTTPGFPSPVAGLGRWIDDPYEYPSPFLLLPRAALAATNSFDAIRAGWFAFQTLALMAIVLLLANWVGGRYGLTAGLLLPLLFASIPTMFDLQFGQFHMMAVALTVAAMIAFEERRAVLGGALLAFAILGKVFPAMFLLYLALRRQWRAAGWTVAFLAGFTLLSIPVVGWKPLLAFFTFQVPRIVTGEAFSFVSRPGVPLFFLSRNFSITSVVPKLGILGLPGMTRGVSLGLTWLFTLAILAFNQRAARGFRSRVGEARTWLALLTIASLRAPLAPSSYVTVTPLWLLTYLAGGIRGRVPLVIAFALAWALIVGPPPLPDRADLVVALGGQALAFGIAIATLFRPDPGSDAERAPAASTFPKPQEA